jgi:hypothetical protein
MADATYAVSNLKVQQRSALQQGGALVQQIVVTYNIGSDGPFSDVYAAAGFTDTEAQAGIQKRVAQLTTIRRGVGAQ